MRFERGALKIPTSLYGGFLIDRDGFIWITTTGLGIYRYDGYELKSFVGELPGLMAVSIVEDHDGLIWASTLSNGVAVYDKSTGTLTHHRRDPDNENSISSNNTAFLPQTLCVDNNGLLWVATDGGGLCSYDKKANKWMRYNHDPNNLNSLSEDAVMAVACSENGDIWVGTQREGLNRFNPKSGSWTRYKRNSDDPNSLSDNWICSILEDQDGELWVGTKSGGLNRFDRDRSTFIRFTHDPRDSDSIGGNEIWSLEEDRAGGIWTSHMVAQSSGIDRFDKKTGIFTRYIHDANNPTTVASNSIVRVVENKTTGALWVLNHDGYIDRHDENQTQFRHWKGEGEGPFSLSNKLILPMMESRDGAIWVGTMAGGLNRINRDNGRIQSYFPDANEPLSIPRTRVTALAEDSSGVMWIGLWDGILAEFDPQTGLCRHIYEPDPSDPNAITGSERLKYILEDKDDPNVLWLATIKGGLDRFDKSSESFTHFKNSPDESNSLSHNSIVSVFDDGEGVLWVPTYGGGLDRFDKRSSVFTNFRHHPGNPESIGSDTLYEVVKAPDGDLWIARKGGLSRFNPRTEKFTNFDRDQNGEAYGAVSGLLQTENGVLWLATINGGIVSFDAETGSTKRFTVDDGIQSNTFFWTSRLETKDGELWFGGSNGITSFYPSQITSNPFVPEISLTSFTQGGLPIESDSSPERLKEVVLDWNANYFEFQFSALDFTSPEKNQYAYKLENWDEDWYYSGSNPFGRYSGLSGGKYTLKLKGSNNDGVWNEEGVSISVIVTPPFWETTWFYALLAIGIISIALAVAFHLRKLCKEIEERKQAESKLEKARQEAEQANLAKDDFLAVMSHEMRTPLNPILGFASLMRQSHAEEPEAQYLDTIINSANSQLELIDDILNFSRISHGNVEAHLSEFNLVEFCHEELNETRPIAGDLELNFENGANGAPVSEFLIVESEKSMLQSLISNLLGNACKYSNEGSITLGLGMSNYADGKAEFSFCVKDTGIGMEASTQKLIFDVFNQADNSHTRKYQGTGLGLAICKKLLTFLDGNISVESELGVGSTFSLTIPMRVVARSEMKTNVASTKKGFIPFAEKHSILLVEDKIGNALVAKAFVQKLGGECIIVDSGQKAIDQCKQQRFDTVLLDLSMPTMNGFEVFQTLRECENLNRHTPIIAVTADTTPKVKERCVRVGFDAYLPKPISIGSLQEAIDRLVEGRVNGEE